MIRTLTCSLLLACCTNVMAEKLYRWVEPDGSITFSPTPPPGDTSYNTVSGAQPKAESSAATAAIKKAPADKSVAATLPTDEQVAPTKLAAAHAATPTNAETPSERIAPARLSYAPDTSGEAGSPAVDNSARSRTGSSKLPLIASSNKRQHCQDLHKRVVSLERRLRSELEPADMDNTVVHMARYQKSFDQFCRH